MRFIFWMLLLLTPALMAMGEEPQPDPSPAVIFMRIFMARVNPSLAVEDPHCATALPWAIAQHARLNKQDWRQVFTLAWQESRFDCHAKSRKDRGGAYGPFQIRRVWESVIGDPRVNYYDPDLAVQRVTQVLRYYQQTGRHQELVDRSFRYPLLCLYNTGERRQVNMKYCGEVGRKMDIVAQAWLAYRAGRLIAISD